MVVHMCVQVMCVYIHVEASYVSTTSGAVCLILWDSLTLPWDFLSRLGCLASKAQGFTYVWFPSSEITSTCYHTWLLFYICFRNWSRVLALQAFPCSASSLTLHCIFKTYILYSPLHISPWFFSVFPSVSSFSFSVSSLLPMHHHSPSLLMAWYFTFTLFPFLSPLCFHVLFLTLHLLNFVFKLFHCWEVAFFIIKNSFFLILSSFSPWLSSFPFLLLSFLRSLSSFSPILLCLYITEHSSYNI